MTVLIVITFRSDNTDKVTAPGPWWGSGAAVVGMVAREPLGYVLARTPMLRKQFTSAVPQGMTTGLWAPPSACPRMPHQLADPVVP